MSADVLIRRALDAGVEIRFIDGKLKVTGKRRAVENWAPRLRPQRAKLIEALAPPANSTARLLEAAMRRCDQFNDSEAARQDMREQVLETPPELRRDLLDHFMGRPPAMN